MLRPKMALVLMMTLVSWGQAYAVDCPSGVYDGGQCCPSGVLDHAGKCCPSGHVDGFGVCEDVCEGGQCEHDVCEVGVALDPTCDSCATEVCLADPFCCESEWDAVCVEGAMNICGVSCTGNGGGGDDDAGTCDEAGGDDDDDGGDDDDDDGDDDDDDGGDDDDDDDGGDEDDD